MFLRDFKCYTAADGPATSPHRPGSQACQPSRESPIWTAHNSSHIFMTILLCRIFFLLAFNWCEYEDKWKSHEDKCAMNGDAAPLALDRIVCVLMKNEIRILDETKSSRCDGDFVLSSEWAAGRGVAANGVLSASFQLDSMRSGYERLVAIFTLPGFVAGAI